ncbi:MAG TPA: Gfo/Idh/MocA family oxidoreductase [Sedimentisphaerales bacterium]|jgi:predicted dehydrogenase|nr:Gfo/Idh/MocA family oxidoreductase [Sedimentisphaerales bacterium]HNU31074.1 Gfo/Idh/MocA family oxidoreductase [Sedimentisphaerales bacterium]
MTKPLNVGIIGYGFMGRTHSNAYRRVSNFFDVPYKPVLKTICGLEEKEAKAFADRWGFESYVTDWHKVIDDKSIDIVDICVPNNYHAELAIAAAEAGKMIICEKPLARTGAEAEPMVKAVEKAGVPNMVSFNYRRIPAVMMAKQLIDSGKLGRIFHYRANFLQDWTISTKVPQGGMATWRLDVKAAGSGVTGDLLAHCIDTALWQNGPITSVCAMTETFVKERMNVETGKVAPVGIDDACTFFCRFGNGSMGNFESTRYARGHKALYTFEINGEHASIAWDLHDLNRLSYFDHRDESLVRGWRSIHVTDGDMPYMSHWWVPGLSVGYEHSFVHQLAEFMDNAVKGKPTAPTFRDALATQYVCDAVLASAKKGAWENVKS